MSSSSIPPELKAGVALARSATVRAWLLWGITAIVLPTAGWAYGQLQTKDQVAALERQVLELTHQQAALVAKIDELTAAPTESLPSGGPIFRIAVEARYAQRAAVRATAAALAYERDKTRKLRAADPVLQAFDSRVRDGKAPSTAGEEAISAVAVP